MTDRRATCPERVLYVCCLVPTTFILVYTWLLAALIAVDATAWSATVLWAAVLAEVTVIGWTGRRGYFPMLTAAVLLALLNFGVLMPPAVLPP